MIFENILTLYILNKTPNKRVKQNVYDRENNKIDTNYYCK